MRSGARFTVINLRTGKRTDVEAIQPRREHRPEFGDSLSEKCNGAISESESQITPETHSDIRYARNPLDR